MKIKTLLDLYLLELQVQNDIEQSNPNNSTTFDMNNSIDDLSNTPSASTDSFSTTGPRLEDVNILNQDLADASFNTDMTFQSDSQSNHMSEDSEHIFNNDSTNSPSSSDKTFTPDLQVSESKHSSRNTTSVATKIKRATGQLASIEARKHNDSDYKMMQYHKDKFEYYRDKVHKKYSSSVRSKARR